MDMMESLGILARLSFIAFPLDPLSAGSFVSYIGKAFDIFSMSRVRFVVAVNVRVDTFMSSNL